jgi:pyoverdine/dityrosine biosynthesis protein Dit1
MCNTAVMILVQLKFPYHTQILFHKQTAISLHFEIATQCRLQYRPEQGTHSNREWCVLLFMQQNREKPININLYYNNPVLTLFNFSFL